MASVFLSPSTQEYNPYYDGKGSEEYYMNLLADYIEPYLKASGISFGRNDPEKRVGGSIAASNAGNYNLHLAMHTNASPPSNAGGQRGIDVYYYKDSAAGKKAAEITAANLAAIYPLPDRVRALPTTTLAELKLTRAPAVLAEIGYHDNKEDAEWIRSSLKQIAKAIALSAAEYLNVPLKTPGGGKPLGKGIVATGGGRLNIRQKPDLQSDIIAQAQNGSELMLLSLENKWYQIEQNGKRGYAFSKYIRRI